MGTQTLTTWRLWKTYWRKNALNNTQHVSWSIRRWRQNAEERTNAINNYKMSHKTLLLLTMCNLKCNLCIIALLQILCFKCTVYFFRHFKWLDCYPSHSIIRKIIRLVQNSYSSIRRQPHTSIFRDQKSKESCSVDPTEPWSQDHWVILGNQKSSEQQKMLGTSYLPSYLEKLCAILSRQICVVLKAKCNFLF